MLQMVTSVLWTKVEAVVWLRVCHRSHTIGFHFTLFYQHDTDTHIQIHPHTIALGGYAAGLTLLDRQLYDSNTANRLQSKPVNEVQRNMYPTLCENRT